VRSWNGEHTSRLGIDSLMKNPLRHDTHGTRDIHSTHDTHSTTVQRDRASLQVRDRAGDLSPNHADHAWKHMQQDVDPDCARDPGSDLVADWELEAAAEGGRRMESVR
jgi:hypothetical protein